MQQKEFERLTGASVSPEEYAGIEKAYMAAGGVDKRTFCAEWRVIGGSETVKAMAGRSAVLEAQLDGARREVERLNELVKRQTGIIGDMRTAADDLNKELRGLAAERANLAIVLLENGLEERAVSLLGCAYVVSVKCSAGLELTKEDRRYIAGVLQGKMKNG